MYHLFLKYISVLIFFFVIASPLSAGNDGKLFTLVIDAGHGGKDAGAIGRYSKEKNINLKVALAFGRLVENNCKDVRVLYTRKTDVFVTLDGRADIANKANADLFISIHTNSLPKGRIAYGTETYTLGIARAEENLEVAKRENSVIMYETNYKQVYEGFDPDKVESYIIFELLQDKNMEQSVELARFVQQQYSGYAGRRNKGVHQAGFLVLRNTSMPGILTELGFISTPAEEHFLNSEAGVKKMAYSLYKGFVNYRRKYDKNCAELAPVKEEAVAERVEVTPLPVEKPSVRTPSVQTNPSTIHKLEPTTVKDEHSRPVFKLQLMVSPKKMKETDKRFKGIKPIDSYQEKGLYKYTTGSSTNYNDIRKLQKSVAGKLKDTFIVAFIDGKRVNLSEAIRISKRK